eukprot:4989421-Amphidinium_carterae.1
MQPRSSKWFGGERQPVPQRAFAGLSRSTKETRVRLIPFCLQMSGDVHQTVFGTRLRVRR